MKQAAGNLCQLPGQMQIQSAPAGCLHASDELSYHAKELGTIK